MPVFRPAYPVAGLHLHPHRTAPSRPVSVPLNAIPPFTDDHLHSESALHLVSYEGVATACLDPFLVLLERVLGLPPVPNNSTRLNVRPPGRVVAATSFLIHYVHLRSDEPTWLAFPCARPLAEARLLPLLPLSCKPFTGWAAALNKRERAAAATTAPGAHRWEWGVQRCGALVVGGRGRKG